ncbi:MAG: flavodoxin-dependent (E)-4-hydroxy-3-methylbut-2-enyl-diphosphate synthase [Candidatus Omnitrophota bacterium]
MAQRRKTRTVSVGTVKIGSGYPISVQSMTKTDTADIDATVYQIRQLEEKGCELVRVAVKDAASARAISSIKQSTRIPIIADIHFDHVLALEAVARGADKIRINPGNIRNPSDIDDIIASASEKNVPIRIGVNSGSLPRRPDGQRGTMPEALLNHLERFRKRRFNNIVISLKSSSVGETVEAYRKIARECDYPFHVGVTAAGLPCEGIVKSSIGIGALLLDGIGDTIRVSLTASPDEEVATARRILASAGVRHFGPEIISCPTCGRCRVDIAAVAEELGKSLERVEKSLVVAVMGCEVNGPGEARDADIGIAFGANNKGAIFRKGKVTRTVRADEAVKILTEMAEKIVNSE